MNGWLRWGGLALVMVAAATAWGVQPKVWTQSTGKDFETAEVKDLAILSTGRVELAPAKVARLEKGPKQIFSLASDAKGHVYAGTGDQGIIYRLIGEKVEEFCRCPAPYVLSLATDADGNLYAGTTPEGTIFRISPDGQAKPFYKGEEAHIWALSFDPKGRLIAGTGPEGKILRIDADGKATVLYDSPEKNILCLGVSADGTVYAGTDGHGLVYRIGLDGKVSVVYDAAETEIRCLDLDPEGNVYVGTAAVGPLRRVAPPTPPRPRPVTPTERPTRPTPSPPPPPTPRLEDTLGTSTEIPPGDEMKAKPKDQPAPPKNNQKKKKKPTGPAKPAPVSRHLPGQGIPGSNSIYRIAPDGEATRLFSHKGTAFFSLLWTRAYLYAGTGNEGHLYRIQLSEDRIWTRLLETKAEQILALLAPPKGSAALLLVGTANDGQVFEVTTARERRGVLLSTVEDTDFISRWGKASWKGDFPKGSIVIQARSGNVQKPDDTWSSWSATMNKSEGEAIPSPPARFLQYRAIFTSKDAVTPVLESVSVVYLGANQSPEITELDVARGGARRPPSRGRPPAAPRSAPAASRNPALAGTVRVSWKTQDPNGDSLRFSLYFKGEQEKNWKPLNEEFTETDYSWDTEAVPDGIYQVKLAADDSPDNPPPLIRSVVKVGEPFTIDNTSPRAWRLQVTVEEMLATITAKIDDDQSRLVKTAYSVDSGDWVPLFPVDGIFDAKFETVKFQTDALEAGEHTVVIRFEDEAGNVGSAKTVFEVQP